MQIGVFAEIGRVELVQFAAVALVAEVGQRRTVGEAVVAIEFKVGLLCRGEESVGLEESWVPQGPLARDGIC